MLAPAAVTAGTSFTFTVLAVDAAGVTAPGYHGTIHFSSTDTAAGLPANYTFTTGVGGDNGVHTFTATLNTAGSPTLTATDTVSGSLTGSSAAIATETAGVAASFQFSAPNGAITGAPFAFTVKALDLFGRTVPGYTGTVHFTSSDSAAGLPAAYTFTTGAGGDNGVHTFTATLNTAGSQTLTATDSGGNSLTGSSAAIPTQALVEASSFLVNAPASATAGVPFSVTVTAKDSSGNTVTGYNGTVHFTSSDTAALLPADYTFTTGAGGDNGVHTFTILLPTAGSQTLTATDTAQTGVTGTSTAIALGTGLGSQDAVLDVNTGQVLPANGTPLTSFSKWAMNLQAQVAGAAVTGYSWNLGGAADAGSISGIASSTLQFTWATFTGGPRTDTIALTVTTAGGSKTLSYTFQVIGTDAPAWSNAPTAATTWPSVITPDQLQAQETQAAGPYASVGLADGSVQTSHSLPTYNPNVSPLGLVYNSAVADPQPVFLVRYQLDPAQALPSAVTAQLTLTNGSGQTVFTGPTVTYDPSALNPGDWMQLALQANAAGLPTGRYTWQIALAASYSTSFSTTYSGAVDLVTGSTTPTTATANPFGPGWSLAGVSRLWPVTGGAILQQPDGTSLWFASGTR